MTSEIRTNSLTSRAGLSTVTLTDSGPMFSGITTFVDNSGFNFGTGSSIFTPASNTLTFGTNSSERLRIGSSGQIGLSGANYGSSGQLLTSQGSGSAPTWTTVSGTTINNNADNRIITGSGTANTLEGEANLTYGGGNLQFTTTANGQQVLLKSTGNYYNKLSFDSGNTSAGGSLAFIDFSWDGDKVADIFAVAGSDTTNKDDGHLVFRTSPSQGSITERLRITSGGQIRLPVNGQQLTWGASQQMKFYYENSEDRMYLQGDGAYGFAFRINSGNRIEIDKTTGDVTMQGASGRNFQWDNSEASLYLTDNGSGASARLKIGSGADLQLYHDVGGANHIVCANNQELKLSANQFSFYNYTGVTRRALLDSDGNLGIGIAAVPQDSGAKTLHIHDSDTGNSARAAIRLTHGSIGSGAGNGAFIGMDNNPDFYLYNMENGKIRFGTNNALRMMISQSGGVIMGGGLNEGVTEPFFVETGGTIRRRYQTVNGSGIHFTGGSLMPTTGTGAFTNGGTNIGTGSYRWGQIYSTSSSISTSDRTLKNTIQSSDLGLDFIKKLNPVSYKFNDGTSGRTHYGLISQDVETVLTSLGKTGVDFGGFCKDKNTRVETKPDENGEMIDVQIEEEGDTYSLRYEEFIGPLVKAIQELTTKIEILEQDNIALRARVTNLEGE